MNQVEQAKPVELVLPPFVGPVRDAAAVPATSSSLWIALVVILVLLGNAFLVWWRIRGRDPLHRAFDAAAGRIGLNRKERKHIGEISPKHSPPVALLLSESAFEGAISGDQSPIAVSIRAKMERARSVSGGR